MPVLDIIGVEVVIVLTMISLLAAMVSNSCDALYSQSQFAPKTDEKNGCEEGSVRLHGGVSSSDGYVEFCQDRRWVEVCSNGWDMYEAMVVCRQLNLGFEGTCL